MRGSVDTHQNRSAGHRLAGDHDRLAGCMEQVLRDLADVGDLMAGLAHRPDDQERIFVAGCEDVSRVPDELTGRGLGEPACGERDRIIGQ
jgi:hypothetical protein